MKGADLAPPADARPPATLAGAARVAFWGLVFWGGEQIAAGVLERSEVAMAAVQAALAEWGADRMGVAWSDPLAPAPTWNAVVRRAARGGTFGAGAAAAVASTALIAHAAALTPSALGGDPADGRARHRGAVRRP